jgi:hypothetical protein
MKSDLQPDMPDNDDTDLDEELDAAAQGALVSDDDKTNEIDAMGEAAGLPDNPEKAFRGVDKIDRRDDKRWELDPKSKNDETGIN